MQEWQIKIIARDALHLDVPVAYVRENLDWFVQIAEEEKTNDFNLALKTLDYKYEEL